MCFKRWVIASLGFLGAFGLGSGAAGDGFLLAPGPLPSDAPEARRPYEAPKATQLTVPKADGPSVTEPTLPPLPPHSLPENGFPAGESNITLAALEEIALANNPTLSQADAWVRAARAKCLQAGLYPNPNVIYRGEEIGTDGRAGQQGAFFAQEIVTAGKLGYRRAVAAHEAQQAEHARQAQYGRVLNDLRATWYDALVAQRALELNQQLVDIGRQGVKAAEQLFQGQEIGRGDVLQFRIEADRAEIQLQEAQSRHRGAWRRLAAIAGVPEMEPAHLVGDLENDLPQLSWRESLERLLVESPELAEARSGVQRARCALAREYAQRVPNLEVEAGVQYQYSNEDTVVGVQLGLPLPIFDRNQGNIFRARAELIAAENEVRRVELALQDRLATAFERYDNARYKATKHARDLMPNAAESLRLVQIALKYEEFDYLTLLNAQRTYAQVSLAYLESLREVRTGGVLIEGLVLTGGLRRADER